MSDNISKQDFENFILEIRKMTSSVERIARNSDGGKTSSAYGKTRSNNAPARSETKTSATASLERDLKGSRDGIARASRAWEKSVDGTAKVAQKYQGAIGFFGQGADEAARSLSRMNKVLGSTVLGGVMGGMVAGTMNLLDNYRNLASVGQTFERSLFVMAQTAGAAGMPLKDFAAMVTKASASASYFGIKTLGDVTKEARRMSHSFGMYGYTIEGLNDVTTQFMEQQRIFGVRQNLDRELAARQSNDIARTVADTAAIFGKSRDEILRITKDAMSSVYLISRTANMSSDQIQRFTTGVTSAVATLSGIQGEGGQMLSTMMADTIGMGQAIFASGADTFIQAGMSSAVSATQSYAKRIEAAGDDTDAAREATYDYIEFMKNDLARNNSSLTTLAIGGNQAAKQLIALEGQLRSFNREEAKRNDIRKAGEEKLSDILASLGDIFNTIAGNFLQGLFEPLLNLEKADPDKFIEMIKNLGDTAMKAGSVIGDVLGKLDMEKLSSFMNFAGEVGSKFLDMVGRVIGLFSWMNEKIGPTATILAGLGTYIMGKLALSFAGDFLKGMFKQRVTINAASVIVNGGGIGGGMGGGSGRGRGPRRGPRPSGAGRMGGLMGAGAMGLGIMGSNINTTSLIDTPTLSRVAGTGVHSGFLSRMGRGVLGFGKGVGKVIGKKIPVAGAGIGAALAASRAMAGDNRGAGMEAASTAMGQIPIVGTIGSLGMDAAIIGRDIVGHERFDRATDTLMTPKNLMNMVAPGMGSVYSGIAKAILPRDAARATDMSISTLMKNLKNNDEDEAKAREQEIELNRAHQSRMENLMEALLGTNQQARDSQRKSAIALKSIQENTPKSTSS